MTNLYTKPASVPVWGRVSTAEANVRRRVATLDRLLKADGGGLELVGVSRDGKVRVRFTGLCVQCPLRPLTAETTVKPVLLELPGVNEVEFDRVRISLEAQQRIARALIGGSTSAACDLNESGGVP